MRGQIAIYLVMLGCMGLVSNRSGAAETNSSNRLLELSGRNYTVTVGQDLQVEVHHGNERVWQSSSDEPPRVIIETGQGETADLLLANASSVTLADFTEGRYRGHTIRLSGYDQVDIELGLVFAIQEKSAGKTDELLVQIEQLGGQDTVRSVEHLYRFEKPVAQGGYIVLPHGSGYLIPADCAGELPGRGLTGGLIGARWSMPIFGMVHDDHGLCVLVETWWDCDAHGEHLPRNRSILDFNWIASLGKLSYPRRFVIRFGQGMDYVAMAKHYRQVAKSQGLVRTLKEKAHELPAVDDYVHSVLYRATDWEDENLQASLDDIQELKDRGISVVFFFPKFATYWQQWLHPNPQEGGWPRVVQYAKRARELGPQIQCMLIHALQLKSDDPTAAPGTYDEDRIALDERGEPSGSAFSSTHDSLDRLKRVLDYADSRGFKMESCYLDTYSAHAVPPEDFSLRHPRTRRQNFEAQLECFAELRRRGIISGGELARFWAIPECTYFFFTDWSNDRLFNVPNRGAPDHVGVPVPIFQLVFHDCYVAGFSGGGYAIYTEGYDWWSQRTPRLYELLFCSVPAHNWLPHGYSPVRDWDSPKMVAHWQWLKIWSAYQRAIVNAELVTHQFGDDWKQHRIEFDNGIVAEFDLARNRYRVTGVDALDSDWQTPPDLY